MMQELSGLDLDFAMEEMMLRYMEQNMVKDKWKKKTMDKVTNQQVRMKMNKMNMQVDNQEHSGVIAIVNIVATVMIESQDSKRDNLAAQDIHM